jgi:hypothetical protein
MAKTTPALAGSGRQPAPLVPLISMLTQLNRFAFALVLESRFATLDIRKYLYDPPNKVALKSSLYALPLPLI